MPHWRKYFPSEYVGAGDFDDKETKIVTIQDMSEKTITGPSNKKELCLIASFKENVKPLIVNVINSKSITAVSGSSNTDDWPGTCIELYVQSGVQAFGETVDAVRVKKYPPRPKKPALDSSHPAYDKVAAAVVEGYTRAQVEQKYTVSDAVWADLQDFNSNQTGE